MKNNNSYEIKELLQEGKKFPSLNIIMTILMTALLINFATAELTTDVKTKLTELNFDKPIIKQVDCNSGILNTACFVLTNNVQTYPLMNINTMICSKPQMKLTAIESSRIVNKKSVPIKTYKYEKTGKCLQYKQLVQSDIIKVMSMVAEKKLIEISGIKPAITNPPKIYENITLNINTPKL